MRLLLCCVAPTHLRSHTTTLLVGQFITQHAVHNAWSRLALQAYLMYPGPATSTSKRLPPVMHMMITAAAAAAALWCVPQRHMVTHS